jgi:hypothetical protein
MWAPNRFGALAVRPGESLSDTQFERPPNHWTPSLGAMMHLKLIRRSRSSV